MNKVEALVCHTPCYIFAHGLAVHIIIAMSPSGVYLMGRQTASTATVNAINKQWQNKKQTSVYSHLGHLRKLYMWCDNAE